VYLSPVAVILANTAVVEPDLVYVDGSRAGLVTDRGIRGAPTLALEVLSPSTSRTDRGPKFQLYARDGIPYDWIADTNGRALEGYALELALPAFAGLVRDLDDLWPSRS
jgi:Uma2 family endonuclease